MSVSHFTSTTLGKIVANLEVNQNPLFELNRHFSTIILFCKLFQGEIIRSSGELENDEAAAQLIPRFAALLRTRAEPTLRLSFHYTDRSYVLAKVNSHFHLLKVTRAPPSVPHLLDAESPVVA